MRKPKMSLTEELRKIDHLNGYNKEFTLEESKKYSEETKNRNYDLKYLTEHDIKSKNPKLLNEWAPLIAGLARIAPFAVRGLATIGRGAASLGARIGTKVPSWGKNLLGLGKISTQGLKTVGGNALKGSTAARIASGSRLGAVGKNIPGLVNAQAAKGLGSLMTWGTGAWLINSFGSGSSTPLPGDAVAGQEDWASGEQPSKDDWMSMCFAPEYYESLVQMDNDDSDITVTFQPESDIAQIAKVIYDATEGGEKYFGKGIVDIITFGATEGAGTEEEELYKAFQAVNTVGDCSYLSKIYQLKYDTPLIEELYDEVDDSVMNSIYNILKGKPLCIINNKRIFTNSDLEELMKEEAQNVIERPEGLPAYRITFKTLFGGETVDIFVGTETAAVFKSGSNDYLGQFQYIENSDDKYYFQTPDGQVYGITDEEDKAKVAKVFGKADEEKDAESDILTLTKDIAVGGTIYDAGESLADIEGPEGTADEYIDELVDDNPTTAQRKPTALQGAAIALAMGTTDFEVLVESVKGLAEVLGESRLVSEQKYTVTFDREDNKYSIRRVRRTVDNTSSTTSTTPSTTTTTSTTPTTTSTTAPTLTAAAAGNGLIKKGMKGDSVSAIQRLLNISPATGVFDATTEQAVKNYQSSNGLKVDGIVGPETANSMIKGIEIKSTPKPQPSVASQESNTEDEIKNTSGRFSSQKAAEQSLENLEKINDTKATKQECIAVIAAASKALPTVGGPKTYKVLQYCYAAYNFTGRDSRRVKRKYGIKSDGDLRNKRR
jgi:hypothetical protein